MYNVINSIFYGHKYMYYDWIKMKHVYLVVSKQIIDLYMLQKHNVHVHTYYNNETPINE